MWHLDCLKEFDRHLWAWHRATRDRIKKTTLELIESKMTTKPHKPVICDKCAEFTHFSIKHDSYNFCLNCFGYLGGFKDRKFSSNYYGKGFEN